MVSLNLSTNTKQLIGFVGGPMAVAQVISIAALPHIKGWYARLNKPKWTPPNWLFGPAWAVLYAAQGYSAFKVIGQQGVRGRAAALWGTQLALNLAWQPLFFNQHKLKVAAVDIAALDVMIAATAWEFRKHNKNAAALMLPYLAWTCFATALNVKIMDMNPPQGGKKELAHAKEINASEAVDAGKVQEGVSFADAATGKTS